MTTLTHLLGRLTNATGADRELDAEIFRAIGAPLPEQFLTAKIALEWNDAEKCFTFDFAETRIRYEQPHFTSSIDAAMSLVPEGMEKEVSDLYGVARAAVGLNVEGGPFYGEHKGCSLPIALCIAAISALKARASCEASS